MRAMCRKKPPSALPGRRQMLLFCALATACGATGEVAGPPAYQPLAGLGPFRRLPRDPAIDPPFSPPFVLSENLDLDEPVVIATGPKLALWLTAHRRSNATQIERADSEALLLGFGDLTPALTADEPWEMGSVSGPSVIPPSSPSSTWLLFYRGGGAIHWATSTDGLTWTKASGGPSLVADGLLEGGALGPPAAVRLGDKVRVYYAARGVLWAAEAPLAEVVAGGATTWTRLDGEPSTMDRDPMIAGVSWATGPISRVYARADLTPAGRRRHDLLFAVAMDPMGLDAIAAAASYSGDQFVVGATSVVKAPARAPAITAYDKGTLLFFVDRANNRDAIAVGLSP